MRNLNASALSKNRFPSPDSLPTILARLFCEEPQSVCRNNGQMNFPLKPTDETAMGPAPRQRGVPVVPRWLLYAGLGAIALGVSFLLDDSVDGALQLPAKSAWRPLARWLTVYGDWWPVGLAGIVAALLCFFRRRFPAARAILLVTLTGLATGVVGNLVRSTCGRTRPSSLLPPGFYGPWHDSHLIFGQYQYSSFVSGHASLLIGLATAAWLVNRWAGVATGLFAAMVSWSRVAQSSHHFSDIVGAALLGLSLAPWLMPRLRKKLEPRFAAREKWWLERVSRHPPDVPKHSG
jgi:membrane-associated phospholipid phosphatase